MRVKFFEFGWFENKILVPIWLERESIAIRILTRFEHKFDDSQPKLGGPRIDRADVDM